MRWYDRRVTDHLIVSDGECLQNQVRDRVGM
jgi:hypothetical protein